MRWVREGPSQEAFADRAKLAERVAFEHLAPCLRYGLQQAVLCFFGHRREQGRATLEMAKGCAWRHAKAARERTHADGFQALLLNEVNRRNDQGVAQIAVVVTAFFFGGIFGRHLSDVNTSLVSSDHIVLESNVINDHIHIERTLEMSIVLPMRLAALTLACLIATTVMPASGADAAASSAAASPGARPSSGSAMDSVALPIARLSVDGPLPGPLAHGAVVIPFHADNLQIAPVFGATAAQVVPRIGHLHLTLDNASWHWVQASNDLIVIQGLATGPHTLRVDLADANHSVIDSRTVAFTIPGL